MIVKRSNPYTEEVKDEGVDGSERLVGRKTMKRRLKDKANKTVVDPVTAQLKELNSGSTDMNQIFKDIIITTKEEKAQKMMISEQKLRALVDRIINDDGHLL